MSNAIPLSELGSPGDDGLRRDRWGRLMVVPPEGGDPVGFTRVTTVAKTTDEGGGLMPWKSTMTAVGLMKRPGLRAKWEALISAHGDPWYAGEEAKAACKRLVEECAEAGGSSDRAEMGTSLHAITAQFDRGDVPRYLTPETERDVEAYRKTLADHGITVASDAVEITVVLDEFQVGGSFDRIYDVPGYGLPLIGDLKTGADLSYSWHSFAVQLAAYSRANAIYTQGAAADGSEDQRAPMPFVDQDHGLVVWLPAGEGRCELHVVDLAAGWEGFLLSMEVRAWRKRKGLAAPHSTFAQVGSPHSGTAPPPIAPQIEAQPPVSGSIEVRAWLQGRIDVIGAHSEGARNELLRSWPSDLASLKASDGHTPAQLLQIEGLLDQIETNHEIPFGPTKPGTQPPNRFLDRLQAAFPGSTLTDEGATQ